MTPVKRGPFLLKMESGLNLLIKDEHSYVLIDADMK